MSVYTPILTRSPYTLISVPADMGKAHIQASNNCCSYSFNPVLVTHTEFLCDSKVSKAVDRDHSTIILNNDCLYPVCRGGKKVVDSIFLIQIVLQ